MDIKEMMAAIDGKANALAEQKQAEEERIAEKAREDIRKILALCPSICELEQIVNMLYLRRLVKKDYYGWDKSGLLTDGINHNLGFVGGGVSYYGICKRLFGITGGGCDGASVYVDYRNPCMMFENEPMTENEMVAKAVKHYSVRSKLDSIANRFNEYRELVERFVKAVCK